MLAAAMLAAPGLALGDDTTTEVKGMIISHQGSTIVVRGDAGDTSVVLTDTTKIRGTSGALGIRGEDHPASDLIRGLAVDVTVSHTGSELIAMEVGFKNGDLKTAQQIVAGLHSTDQNVAQNAEGISKNAEGISKNAEGVAQNSQRINDVGLLVPRGRTKVFFATGSSAISETGKHDLQALAAQAKALTVAYRLAVVGRADTTGNPTANQRLSEARAAAVTNYLLQACGILPGSILPTAAVGSSPIADDRDPPASAAEARRVTVTIAVSKSSVG
jgi:outer membrane protein OmpA-like peptidoglycan-associated protein